MRGVTSWTHLTALCSHIDYLSLSMNLLPPNTFLCVCGVGGLTEAAGPALGQSPGHSARWREGSLERLLLPTNPFLHISHEAIHIMQHGKTHPFSRHSSGFERLRVCEETYAKISTPKTSGDTNRNLRLR